MLGYFLRRADLIDLVSLSKLVASKNGMTNGEASDLVTSKIISLLKQEKDDEGMVWVTDYYATSEIEIYDTSGSTLPKKINSKAKAIDAVYEVFNSNWWQSESELQQGSGWEKAVNDFAVERAVMDIAFSLDGLTCPPIWAKNPSNTTFDEANPAYPIELDMALQAWQAVTATEGKGKPKARLRAWLDGNTKLSNEAKERIATVANWDKTGGATRTD